MADPVLEAVDVAADIPGNNARRLLEGVNLTVSAGEAIAIIGRSGSGKSTLLSILGLLMAPSAGDVRVRGAAVSSASDARRAAIRNSELGFVFQDYALIRELDVRANVEMPLDYAGMRSRSERRERVSAALDLVGMAGSEPLRPGKLSGGEQQRVAIARALVTKPKIVLADEPTGALDTKTGDDIMKLLRHATNGSDSCLIVVTHDPVVAGGADRVLELREGTLNPYETVP